MDYVDFCYKQNIAQYIFSFINVTAANALPDSDPTNGLLKIAILLENIYPYL